MYRPAPRPLMLVFSIRAVPLKDDSASAPRKRGTWPSARPFPTIPEAAAVGPPI